MCPMSRLRSCTVEPPIIILEIFFFFGISYIGQVFVQTTKTKANKIIWITQITPSIIKDIFQSSKI